MGHAVDDYGVVLVIGDAGGDVRGCAAGRGEEGQRGILGLPPGGPGIRDRLLAQYPFRLAEAAGAGRFPVRSIGKDGVRTFGHAREGYQRGRGRVRPVVGRVDGVGRLIRRR